MLLIGIFRRRPLPDNHFVLEVADAIRELQRIALDNPMKANHRYSQLTEDLRAVVKRFLRGEHCTVCDKASKLPPIRYTTFCSDKCKRFDEDRKSQAEARIQESIAEHTAPEAQL